MLVSQTNIGNLAEGDVWDTPVSIYPSLGGRPNPDAPKAVTDSMEEARLAFRARAHTASAVMCRRTLEVICKLHGAEERALAGSLKKLKEKGDIDERLYQWADTLRLTGNAAAHYSEEVITHDDARDMLDFTNAIVDYLYSFKDKFEAFKLRRAKTKI